MIPVLDEPWRSSRTPAPSGADIMADEISKVVARLPNNNRPERPDAASTPANCRPAPRDTTRIESPPIADHQIARVGSPERLRETDFESAALPALRGEVRSRGTPEALPEIRPAAARLPPWLVAARLVDNAPVDDAPTAGEMRATGPEGNVAAQPRAADAGWSVNGRSVAIAAVLLLMMVLSGTFWLLRPGLISGLAASISNSIPHSFSPPAFASSRNPIARSAEPNLVTVPPKSISMVLIDPPAASESGSSSAAPAPLITPAAERAILYEEDPTDPQGKRYTGGVTWHTEKISSTSGTPPEFVVKADLKVDDAKTEVSMTFRRNTDNTMPASHVVEIKFDRPKDAPNGEVSKLHGLLMKQEGHGAPLEGESAKVTPGYFMVALASGTAQLQRNLKLLKDDSWFEVVIGYSNGKRAVLAIDKGASGEEAFKEAFAAWGE